MTEYEIEIYGEVCCDFCNEIIHNHFTCPACGNDYASSNICESLWDHASDEINCEECGAWFVTVDGSNLNYDINKVRQV